MEDHDEAQRVLERKALVNVRALMDKLEAEERSRTSNALRFAIRFTPALLVSLVVIGGIAAHVASRSRQPPQPPLNAAAHIEQIFSED